MKTRLQIRMCLLIGMATFNLSLMPALMAQTQPNPPVNPNAPDNQQNSKTTDSPAEQSGTTGAPSNSGSQDRTDSKNPTSLDNNPSTAETPSLGQPATKTPTGTEEENQAGGSSTNHEGSLSTADRTFIMRAAQGGMTEVELGKVAQQNASAANVKEFGGHMVADHSQANSKLLAIAKEKGVPVSSSLDAKHQATVNDLSKLSGTSFDKAYVDNMVKDHQHDAAAFQKEADTTRDPELKAFASETLQTVKSHLTMIKQIQSGK
jgi:putative membrane protein